MAERERRQHKRHPFAEEVHVLTPGERASVCVDVSEGGMAFVTDQPLPKDTKLTVLLFARSVSVAAVSRHQTQVDGSTFITGAEFVELQPELAEVASLVQARRTAEAASGA